LALVKLLPQAQVCLNGVGMGAKSIRLLAFAAVGLRLRACSTTLTGDGDAALCDTAGHVRPAGFR
jgi:hypothetical protein